MPQGNGHAEVRAERWVQGVTGHVISAPPLRDLIDERLGPGTAQRTAARIAETDWSPPREPAPEDDRGTSSRDLHNCYLLLHDRAPEAAAVTTARPKVRLLDTIIEFLTSPEFAAKTVGDALDRKLDPNVLLAGDLVDWLEEALGIALEKPATRADAIVQILSTDAIAERLGRSGIAWSAESVVRAIAAAEPQLRNDQVLAIEAYLQSIARGIEVIEVSGMAAADRRGGVQYTNSDPWVRFRLGPEVCRSDLAELHFRASLDGQNTCGHLYLDYGSGHFTHEDSLPLVFDQQQFGRAIVANPGNLHALRWDPTNASGAGVISVLGAKPMTVEDCWQSAQAMFEGEAGLLRALTLEADQGPQRSLAAALTRVLSRRPKDYLSWLALNEPCGEAGMKFWRNQLASLPSLPLISVIVPTFNTDERLLREMIDSVLAQVYPNWELCIADDCSTLPHVRRVLQDYAARDPRIRFVVRTENGHISAASNSALALASGEWLAMLDHDDLLRPNALLAVAVQIARSPEAELIYSDEDKVDSNGLRFQPYFKPDFSPETLLAHNYLNHLSVFRAATVRAVGGWREGLEGSQDYDLILRLLDTVPPGRVFHIPEILYHWRAIAGSTALAADEKGYAAQAGLRALRDHLGRRNTPALATQVPGRSFYRVLHEPRRPAPKVTLVMPTRDMASLVEVAAKSILEKSTYEDFELLIVDNGSVQPETFALFDELRRDSRVTIIPYPHPFNYSAINNHAVRQARGSVIGLINNDIEVITPGWIEELWSWAMQDGIGCVGAKLYYPDMSVQHAGVVIGLGGIANHIHRQTARDDPGYFGRTLVHHNVSAVTGACLFVRKDIYDQVGGLEEELQIAFNDVDFCLRVGRAGYRNLYTPFAELIHHESKSRGKEDTPEKIARFTAEIEFMDLRWGSVLRNDPYYSPNFDLMGEDCALGVSPYRKAAG